VPLLARTLPSLRAGTLEFIVQDEGEATFCRKLGKEDAALDFSSSAAVLAARINGLNPWPAAQVENAGQPLKFGLADAFAGSAAPGVVSGQDGEGLFIGTGAGLLRVRRLQRPGGRMLPAAEFLRGCPLVTGTVFPSGTSTSLVAKTPFPVVKSL
jgi:methionyl-tRNA formyltransferase